MKKIYIYAKYITCVTVVIIAYIIGQSSFEIRTETKNSNEYNSQSLEDEYLKNIQRPRPYSENYSGEENSSFHDPINGEPVAAGRALLSDPKYLWESTAQTPWRVRDNPLSHSDWYVSGLVKRNEKTQILIKFSDQPNIKIYSINDVLPGNFKIINVDSQHIDLRSAKNKSIRLPIFRTENNNSH